MATAAEEGLHQRYRLEDTLVVEVADWLSRPSFAFFPETWKEDAEEAGGRAVGTDWAEEGRHQTFPGSVDTVADLQQCSP